MQAVRTLLRTTGTQLQARSTATATSKPNSRRMKFPYTMTAMFAQMPWRMHFEGFWLYRMMIPGLAVTFVVFYKIHQLANSPANVAAVEERKRREAEKKHHH